MRLEAKLTVWGCENINPHEFRVALRDAAASLCPTPDWPQRVDHILCRPRELSQPLVREMRRRFGCPSLPEHVVLESLLNLRKGDKGKKKQAELFS